MSSYLTIGVWCILYCFGILSNQNLRLECLCLRILSQDKSLGKLSAILIYISQLIYSLSFNGWHSVYAKHVRMLPSLWWFISCESLYPITNGSLWSFYAAYIDLRTYSTFWHWLLQREQTHGSVSAIFYPLSYRTPQKTLFARTKSHKINKFQFELSQNTMNKS